MKPPIANFDSAAAMLKATANFLKGKDFPAVGQPQFLENIVPAVNWLPRKAREKIYAVGGMNEAISARRMMGLKSDHIYGWAASLYPKGRQPCVFVGSSNGALTNLCAAMGAPWLPQTVFLPLRQISVSPDEPKKGLEKAREVGIKLLEKNPDLQLHQLHDPNQDRLMLDLMTYFRIKKRSLGAPYEDFLDQALAPGDTMIMVECTGKWPVTTVADRYYFQFGAEGGMPSKEYFTGSKRIAEYLKRYDVGKTKWDPPKPDAEVPEAEWGFEPALRDDAERYAKKRGLNLARLIFKEPTDLSPFVSELYRWWYRRRGMADDRLFVESFLLVEPYWTLRAGLVPFWLTFATEPEYKTLKNYLEKSGPFDEMHMALFSHGTEGVGVVPIEKWRELFKLTTQRRGRSDFVGVDENLFPLDFATFGQFQKSIRSQPARFPVNSRLTLDDLRRFIDEEGHRFKVEWKESNDTAIMPAAVARQARARQSEAPQARQ